ncbi:hypothetical protein B0H14DRAFT_2567305 [Mycena olivaceomarginata]|nr:hypothetical protein B0H14DRAFT_2567305 [Mycena olivaceomarginata]
MESDRDEQIEDEGEQEEDPAEDNDDDPRSFRDAGDSQGLQKVLDDERPRWTHGDQAIDDNNAGAAYQHPASRASMSSGYLSVPVSDASDSDSDSDGPIRRACPLSKPRSNSFLITVFASRLEQLSQ